MIPSLKHFLLTSACLACLVPASAQKDKHDLIWFNHIKLGAFAGFQAYGIKSLSDNTKEIGLTTIALAEINIVERAGKDKFSLYGEFINQPMMEIISTQMEIDLLFVPAYDAYYQIYMRSQAYNTGLSYAYNLKKNWDFGVKIGLGSTYFDIREYFTPNDTRITEHFDHSGEKVNFNLGVYTNYTLRNKLGVYAETGIAYMVPTFRTGLTYLIPSK